MKIEISNEDVARIEAILTMKIIVDEYEDGESYYTNSVRELRDRLNKSWWDALGGERNENCK